MDRDAVEREILRTADTVQATDGRDDDNIFASGEQCCRSREPQPVNLLVDAQVLLDIGVRGRDIGLGLIIVIITDEVLHSVVREEHLHLRIELCSQGLVVGENKRRTVELSDDISYSKRLATTGYAEQRFGFGTGTDAVNQRFDGLRLVAGRLICRL